jgi:hypothetical protein
MLGIVAAVLVQFAWVKPTNFAGYDEWLILSQVARSVADVPYANRPLELLFSLPLRWAPQSLWSYFALHVAYFAAEGCLVYVLCLRLLPGQRLVAFLAGVFAATWGPLDHQRLNVVQPYAGFAFWCCLALLLLVESWRRGQPLLLCLAALLAFVDIRAYEACGALLLGAPLLLLWQPDRPANAYRFVAAWEALVLLALALTALPHVLPGREDAYQQLMMGGLDLHPARYLERLLLQYRYHLLPLLEVSPAQLLAPAVALALAAYAVPFALLARSAREPLPRRRDAGRVAALGLVLAGLAYAVLVATAKFFLASRTQFVSAPGIALFLAGAFAWLASLVPPRLQAALLGVLGGWVVAVGTERTLFLQQHWDRISVYREQTLLLRSLQTLAPHFRPNTLVLLIDEADVFKATFPLRHALLYLYPGEAIGYTVGKWDFGYPIRFGAAGIASEPWPSLRQETNPATFHRFDEVVVLHQPKAGPLRMLEDWPEGVLPPLPSGQRYLPRTRIASGPLPPQRRVLDVALR